MRWLIVFLLIASSAQAQWAYVCGEEMGALSEIKQPDKARSDAGFRFLQQITREAIDYARRRYPGVVDKNVEAYLGWRIAEVCHQPETALVKLDDIVDAAMQHLPVFR